MPNADTATAQRKPQRFFANTALLMAMLVFLSFPLTYYLPVVTGTHSFQLLYHVHGLACFAWIGLLAWQARLVAQGNIARHRELGLSGAALVLPLQLSSPWIARSAWWNGIAPTLLGSG